MGKIRPLLGLLRVNSIIHKEASQVFYGENQFRFSGINGWIVLSAWLNTITPRHYQFLQHLTVHVPFEGIDHLSFPTREKIGYKERNCTHDGKQFSHFKNKGFQCPGYERAIDRLFQDESAAVERKTQKAKAKALIAREERENAEKARRAIVKMQDAIGVPLLCPLIDKGIAFFMMHYAAGLDQPPMSSSAYNQHLSTYGFHPIVATVMTALGLAGVANLFMDGAMKREATKWYSDALNMTNKALTKSSEAKSDNTLLATMLLSVFEATNNERSLVGWTQHVTGSASLLRMRGKAQFETPAGRRMYMQTVGLLTMKCMGMGIALPQFVHDFNEEVTKWEDAADPGNRFFHMHIAAIDFRAQILNHQLTDLKEIVERALQIDELATNIFESVGKEWEYVTETCDEGTPGVFGNSYHIYPHLAAAQTWNWVRYNRIYLHDIIRNSLITGFGSTPPVFVGKKYMHLLESSTETLYQMQADILASIPQYLHDTPKVPSSFGGAYTYTYAPTSTREGLSPPSVGDKPSPSPTTTPEFRIPATPTSKLPVIRVSGGYSSLWGLFIAGSTPIASPESQAFVLRSLERATTEFGINQAKVLASALRTKIELEKRGISEMAEREMMNNWEGGWYAGLGEQQKITIKNAALKGGEGGIAPVYMPRVGSHVED
ncbi:hypothetical protein N0V90_005168 [Kalmusia sp. IMI 367209]|nr:hypothetical protein N0V90_005168 [Kalmusia sp. IMI 367209]